MSIAYGFDPNISPIYDDENETMHSVHFSSADTPRNSGRVTNRTMGASRISTSLSGDFHDFHRECVPETSRMSGLTEEIVENSEEIHFDSHQEEYVSDSREAEIEDEIVPESVGYLEGTFIVLSAGCCIPIRHHLSKKLMEMGAEVQKTVDPRTTHIVVDRYADEALVGIAMSRIPPPLMVDIKWIQECLDNRKKCEETDYSMTGLRYLRQTCRRLSSFREPSPFDETEWEDMENEAPTDPAKLLEEIRKLSERMDALLDYVPVIRFEYHSPDCPTRQRPEPAPLARPVPPARPNPTKLSPPAFRNLLTSISTKTAIKRRRSFTGFILEHRNPSDDVIELQKINKDTREIWEKPKNKKNLKNPKNPKNPKKAPQKTVNDMRKTMPTDLTAIRDTLCRNADINRARTPKKAPKPQKKPQSRTKMEPVRADDSDIQSALASLTISVPSQNSPGNSNSIEVIEDTSKKRAPLVHTKSNVINSLQNEEDDFISDVSAFILNRKTQSRRATEEEVEEMRNQVVFTGFNRDSSIEKKLKSIVRRFKLTISTEIDESRTVCIVSRHGKRTLVVLKAICCNIPIVRPQWLEESFEDSQLLPSDDYVYDEWLFIKNNKIFEHFHLKMWFSPDCNPNSTELAWMVQKCGGKITRHLHKADLVIAPETFLMPEIHAGLETATPLFVIDSISMAALQNYLDYVE